MSRPWFEKYRPKSRHDLIGNKIAINGLYLFITKWKRMNSKVALLIGPPGCGKTSAVYAIARDLGYSVTEVNASDTRKKDSIKEILGTAVRTVSFNQKVSGKLILMDEVDGLSGRFDRGGLAEFLKISKQSVYPIICTANDPDSDIIDKINCSMIGLKSTKKRITTGIK